MITTIASTGADVLLCSAVEGRVDLTDLLRKLGERGVQSVLLEGGATLAGAFLRQRLIDRCLFFYAPKLLGGGGINLFGGEGVSFMRDAIKLGNISVQQSGEDILIEGELEYRCLQV
jgi:diaminohydroxyphosphoribosylaminopyrimidine deaminase/5-amino-6-(5-phosphoribosylamino)uracil reductase